MDVGGPSTGTGSDKAGTPSASSGVPNQTTRANTDMIEILQDSVHAMLSEDREVRWNAAIKLNAVVEREKEKGRQGGKEDSSIATPIVTTGVPNAVQVPTQVAYVRTESAIRKPRTGAGVTKKKKTVARNLRSGSEQKVKAKGGMEKGMGGQIIPTTATEAMEPPPTKTSPEVLHGQRRRSMRIIELVEKAAREKGEPAAAGLDKGKEVVGGGFRG